MSEFIVSMTTVPSRKKKTGRKFGIFVKTKLLFPQINYQCE